MTKATLKYTGEVYWEPPAIYKSSCEINVEYFPYDEQTCFMKFGSWTYNGAQVDLRHMEQQPGSNLVVHGIDLKEFYPSVEWDILEIPAGRNEEYYPCCTEPFAGSSQTLLHCAIPEVIDSNRSFFYSRYHFQIDHAPENSLLHRKFDYSMCRFDILDRSCILFAQRFWREGEFQSPVQKCS